MHFRLQKIVLVGARTSHRHLADRERASRNPYNFSCNFNAQQMDVYASPCYSNRSADAQEPRAVADKLYKVEGGQSAYVQFNF